MGGGGLRILGHKKWHVWRRDNIERVLRDEREHADQQRLSRDQQRRRDQEVRADALGQAQQPVAAVSHINFFEKEEEAHTLALLSGGDHEAERHRRPHRQQQANETQTLGRQAQLPWYATATSTLEGDHNKRHGHNKRKRAIETQDPLLTMRPPRYAAEKEADDDEDERVRQRRAEKKDCSDKASTRRSEATDPKKKKKRK